MSKSSDSNAPTALQTKRSARVSRCRDCQVDADVTQRTLPLLLKYQQDVDTVTAELDQVMASTNAPRSRSDLTS